MPRRKAGKTDDPDSSIPDVYRDLLADAASSPMQSDDEGRSIKKRRVAGRVVTQTPDSRATTMVETKPEAQNNRLDELFDEPNPVQQEIFKSESEDSADSDVDWEEVELKHSVSETANSELDSYSGELDLVLGNEERGPSRLERDKRKPITAAERKLRLGIHKMHLCSLLIHVYIRNHWCNDRHVHSAIRKLLNKKLISYLNPEETASQFQRSRSFVDGLRQASDVFRHHFRITRRGMAKPHWKEASSIIGTEVPDDIELPTQREDFVSAASGLKGSRDLGAQLFCSMLRAAGVDARLVCSLQPLQFRAVEKTNIPQQIYSISMPPEPETRIIAPEAESADEERSTYSTPVGSRGGRNRFTTDPWGDPSPPLAAHLKDKPKKPIRESKYPVFWVEAFNEAIQKWIPVDPLVTQTIAKSSKLEPPAGERDNSLSYVIAFEDDASARDVTRRYAKAYNAKTRRGRVEATKGGDIWWRRTIKMFRQRYRLDRDQLEDAELTAKEGAEPMPRNVQDFKDHPYYALERHLRRHEVIHPRREVGKVGAAGKGHNSSALEPIYRRRDVLHVQSADKWYRQGRAIKAGEQPLKRVAARKKRQDSLDEADQDESQAGTPLYTLAQTIVHIPSPITDNRIPKNAYGNLDVYVPSMIPAGGAHIQHPETARVARLLGIDYADAITGFTFKGRHGTAVTNGAVVAAEHVEAVLEVIHALEDERVVLEQERRCREVLGVWKRLLIGLRIRERIEGYDIEGERGRGDQAGDDMNEGDDNDDGGGFLPDRDAGAIAEPTAMASNRPPQPSPHPSPELEPKAFIPQRPPLQITVTYPEPIRKNSPSPSASAIFEPPTGQNGLFDDNAGEGGGFLISNPDDDNDDGADQPMLQTAIAATLLEAETTIQTNDEVTKTASGEEKSGEAKGKSAEQRNSWAGVSAEEGGFLNEEEGARDGVDKGKGKEVDTEERRVERGDGSGDDLEEVESDKGSLLSHDPEDEDVDVDPDWMD